MIIADAERLIGRYLRDYPGLGVRVRGTPPSDDERATSWIMLTQLDADNDAGIGPDYLITHMLQFDCYAGEDGGQPEAVRLGGSVREALAQLNYGGSFAGTVLGGSIVGGTIVGGTIPGGTGVVSGLRFSGHARVPDTEGFEPARERVVLDALVTIRPVPPGVRA